MDFLNKASARLKDLFATMTPGARITAGLLLAVVVISLVYLFRYNVSGADEYLLGARAFSTSELAAIEAAFAKAGLGNYRIEGNRVRIPRSKKASYIAAMADDNALPADFNEYVDSAIKSANPFESRAQRDARLKNAKQKELSLYVRSMKGIENAGVQYDVEETRTFPRKKVYTAMVAVRPAGGEELSPERVKCIRNIVSSAIAGLKPEHVGVTDLNTGVAYAGKTGVDGADGNAYGSAKRYYDKLWRDEIRGALRYIKGVIVSVNTTLDPTMRYQQGTLSYDPKNVATLKTSDSGKTLNTTAPAPTGRPGAESQSINRAASVAQRGATTDLEETRSETERVPGQETVNLAKAGLVPKEVTVSVSVPSSYYRQIWEAQNPVASGEKPEKPKPHDLTTIEDKVKKEIEEKVVPLLPSLPAGTDPYPRVNVTSFQPIATAPEPAPTATATAVTWLGDNWGKLGMMVVGLFGLLMLRGMVRAAPDSPASSPEQDLPRLSVTGDEDAGEGGGESEGESEQKKRVLQRNTGGDEPDLREELTHMVQEDPDAAAKILRNWIGSPT